MLTSMWQAQECLVAIIFAACRLHIDIDTSIYTVLNCFENFKTLLLQVWCNHMQLLFAQAC